MIAPGTDHIIQAELLRPREWFLSHGAIPDATIHIDLEEMGVQGPAFVQSIEPCPEIESGEGRVITGTFQHLSGNVYDLLIASEPHPIGVTGTHPIWSMDRLQWVPVKDLEPGEQVLTLSGTTEVLSILFRDEQVPVYNIEVEGDHVYRVGQSGVLVHNASANATANDLAKEAAEFRSKSKKGNSWGDLARGIHNLGKIYIRVNDASGSMVDRESNFYGSQGGHSEKQAIEWARRQGLPQCGIVVWLFTERAPCGTCRGRIKAFEAELKKAGQPSKIPIIQLVSFDDTRQYEEEPGGRAKWDPHLLSWQKGSYQQRKLFFLNDVWRNSEWYPKGYD